MPQGGTVLGNILLALALLGTIGIGGLALLGLVIGTIRRRVRVPGERSALPHGWQVIVGGKHTGTRSSSEHRRESS